MTKVLNTPQVDTQLLWAKLKVFEIDDLDSNFRFSHRLANENLWSKEYTLRVIEEYKKFMFLCCVCPPVTPSIDVDECWHLHMIYTHQYWKDLCKDILNIDIHHGPTKGGKEEDIKYELQYEKTLHFYSSYFGTPPADIWPSSKIRFAPANLVKIDLKKHWVIPVGDFKALFKALKQYFKIKKQKQ